MSQVVSIFLTMRDNAHICNLHLRPVDYLKFVWQLRGLCAITLHVTVNSKKVSKILTIGIIRFR